jgi:hypothetical protein
LSKATIVLPKLAFHLSSKMRSLTKLACVLFFFALRPSSMAQFTIEPSIVEQGEIGILDDIPEGVICLQRKSAIVLDDWAYFPITVGKRKTSENPGWAYPSKLEGEVLAGVARLDCTNGRTDYCRIPQEMRAPYGHGDVVGYGSTSACFKAIVEAKTVSFVWHGNGGFERISDWRQDIKQLPTILGRRDLLPVKDSERRVREGVFLQKSADGYIAYWFDLDGFHVGEFAGQNWLWLYGIDSIRKACELTNGEAITIFSPLVIGEPSRIPILLNLNGGLSSYVVLVGKDTCKLLLTSDWKSLSSTRLSSDGKWLLISDNTSFFSIVNLVDETIEEFRNKGGGWASGVTRRGIVFQQTDGSLKLTNFESWETTELAPPLLPGEQLDVP